MRTRTKLALLLAAALTVWCAGCGPTVGAMMNWSSTSRQEEEQAQPLPPYTKVTAIQNFEAEHPHDLPFSRGDRLTILEPCNVIFWYLAEDAHGKRGVIPINFVRVDSGVEAKTKSKPKKPPPPPPPSSSSSSSANLNPSRTNTTPEPRHRRLSPQTMPRSSMHPQIYRTSSAERLDNSHAPPPTHPKSRFPSPPPSPPLPLMTSSTPPTADDNPPAVPPRHPPPLPSRDPAGGTLSTPRSMGATPGRVTPTKPPAPLPPSPKPQPPAKKLPLQPKPGTRRGFPSSPHNRRANSPPQSTTTTRPPLATPGAGLRNPPAIAYENKEPALPMSGPPNWRKSQGPPNWQNLQGPPGWQKSQGPPDLQRSQGPPDLQRSQEPPIDIDNRPPAPLPPEAFLPAAGAGAAGLPMALSAGHLTRKYSSSQEFIAKSGWFQPTVEAVLCRKASVQLPVFQTMTTGLYVFKHRFRDNMQYVGKSRNLYSGLIQMFHRLYEKPENKLNPVEMHLKYFHPDADEWYVRFVTVRNVDDLDLEQGKMIAQLRTVQPDGLNSSLEFYSREDWYRFAAWYKDLRSKAKAKAKEKKEREEGGGGGRSTPVLTRR